MNTRTAKRQGDVISFLCKATYLHGVNLIEFMPIIQYNSNCIVGTTKE